LANDAEFIEKRLRLTVANLKTDGIYYRAKRYDEPDNTYKIEREKYLSEVKTGFGWVVSNDGSKAIMVDRNGGAVFNSDLEPIQEGFSKILTIQAEQEAKIKEGQRTARPGTGTDVSFDDVEAF
jgi:hypothetical protein